MRTITHEAPLGQIGISTQYDADTGELVTAPAPRQTNDSAISDFKPDRPPPPESLVIALDDGPSVFWSIQWYAALERTSRPANDNSRPRYNLHVMAQSEKLGCNEFENLRHWEVAQRFKRDYAISKLEPLGDSADNQWPADPYMGEEINTLDSKNGGLKLNDDMEFNDDAPCDLPVEPRQFEVLYAQQVMSLAEDQLADDFGVLTQAIVDNATTEMIGMGSGYSDRASLRCLRKGIASCRAQKSFPLLRKIISA